MVKVEFLFRIKGTDLQKLPFGWKSIFSTNQFHPIGPLGFLNFWELRRCTFFACTVLVESQSYRTFIVLSTRISIWYKGLAARRER